MLDTGVADRLTSAGEEFRELEARLADPAPLSRAVKAFPFISPVT